MYCCVFTYFTRQAWVKSQTNLTGAKVKLKSRPKHKEKRAHGWHKEVAQLKDRKCKAGIQTDMTQNWNHDTNGSRVTRHQPVRYTCTSSSSSSAILCFILSQQNIQRYQTKIFFFFFYIISLCFCIALCIFCFNELRLKLDICVWRSVECTWSAPGKLFIYLFRAHLTDGNLSTFG